MKKLTCYPRGDTRTVIEQLNNQFFLKKVIIMSLLSRGGFTGVQDDFNLSEEQYGISPCNKPLGKTKSKKKKREVEIQEREAFIDVYAKFNQWLSHLGFRSVNCEEAMSPLSFHYSYYDEHIDSLWGVESYICDPIKYRIYFLRDRYEHKMMFVGYLASHSEVLTLDQAKEQIKSDVRKFRDEKIAELQKINLD